MQQERHGCCTEVLLGLGCLFSVHDGPCHSSAVLVCNGAVDPFISVSAMPFPNPSMDTSLPCATWWGWCGQVSCWPCCWPCKSGGLKEFDFSIGGDYWVVKPDQKQLGKATSRGFSTYSEGSCMVFPITFGYVCSFSTLFDMFCAGPKSSKNVNNIFDIFRPFSHGTFFPAPFGGSDFEWQISISFAMSYALGEKVASKFTHF